MKLDRGYISPHFITNTKNQKCVSVYDIWYLFDFKKNLTFFKENSKDVLESDWKLVNCWWLTQELDDPIVLIHEKKISSISSIIKVLELALKVKSPKCVVICKWLFHSFWNMLCNYIFWCFFILIQKQRPLLIVAEDVESEALATLILNKLRAGIKVFIFYFLKKVLFFVYATNCFFIFLK